MLLFIRNMNTIILGYSLKPFFLSVEHWQWLTEIQVYSPCGWKGPPSFSMTIYNVKLS